jgi:site-specific recombinase XerD
MTDNFRLLLHQYAEQLELGGYGKRTIDEYPRIVGRCFEYFTDREGIRSIEEITPVHLGEYHTYLQFTKREKTGKPLSTKTICGILGAIKVFYRIMSREKLIGEDLSEAIRLPVARKRIPRNVPGTAAVRTLIEAAEGTTTLGIRDRAILEFMYATGIRSEELRTITLADYDMVERQVFIRGKGRRERIVPVGGWVQPYVTDYLANSRPKLLRKKTSELLFVSRNGRKLNRNSLWYLVNRYAAKAGMERITVHMFRHACATHLLRNGADIRIVQELLGHEHLTTTQRYTHILPVDVAAAVERLHPRRAVPAEAHSPSPETTAVHVRDHLTSKLHRAHRSTGSRKPAPIKHDDRSRL